MPGWMLASALAGAALALALVVPGIAVTAGGGTWAKTRLIPTGIAEVGVATVNGDIYAIGRTEQGQRR